MAFSTSSSTSTTGKSAGLEFWMARVSEVCPKVENGWEADQIHDLRVALRRTRTMAEAIEEVNPGPGWKAMRKSSRELFHALGDLRDTQVEKDWIRKLGAAGDPVRREMLRQLSVRERKQRHCAKRALEDFDLKSWRRLCQKLSAKAQFFPMESVVYQRLALGRLNEAVELYRRARKRGSSAAWHRLRIAIKHFRYVLENFLPQRYEVWAEDLKMMQDLLGEVHDLDVLRSEIGQHRLALTSRGKTQWLGRIRRERQERLAKFSAKTTEKDSPWIVWRAGFHWGHALVAASFPQRRIA